MRIVVDAEDMARHAGGTVFQDGKPRVVEIRDIAVDAAFAPHMIYVRNDDKPGFIGRFGTLLGEAGVNVATFALGRDKPGGDAICFVGRRAGVDGTPAPDRGDPPGEARGPCGSEAEGPPAVDAILRTTVVSRQDDEMGRFAPGRDTEKKSTMALRFLVVEGTLLRRGWRTGPRFGLMPCESYAGVLQAIAPDGVFDLAFPADEGANLPDPGGLQSMTGWC